MLSLECSTLNLTWTPPFSLDILGVDPDITGYCVDVVSSTSSATLHSECNITRAEFTNLLLPTDSIQFTVTPVNVVGNGTASVSGSEDGTMQAAAAAVYEEVGTNL